MTGLNKLRMNLTLVNTLVLIGMSAFIAVLLYVSMNMDMESGVNNNLEIYCSQLANNIDYLESGKTEATETATGYNEFKSTLINNSIAFTIWNDRFELLDGSDSRPLSDEQLLSLINRYFQTGHEKYMINDYENDSSNLKICTYAFVTQNGELKVVQAIKDMNTERSVFQTAISTIVWVVVLGTAVSLVLGYLLSGRSLKPIRNSMERQREFLADASHELRTPIAVIQTNLEVLRSCKEETVESQRNWIDNAYGESRRMHHIVEDLMFLARADSGDLTPKKEPVDLTYLIMEVTERFTPLAARKQITLLSDVPADELFTDGDEKQLTQLLVILIDNAIKYSGEKTTIVVRAARTADGIEMSVSDQGIGIAQEDQKKIFERFYRVDKVRSRQEGGTGLGLSIAWWIVQNHKGSITVESQENKGTTMRVLFRESAPLKEIPS